MEEDTQAAVFYTVSLAAIALMAALLSNPEVIHKIDTALPARYQPVYVPNVGVIETYQAYDPRTRQWN